MNSQKHPSFLSVSEVQLPSFSLKSQAFKILIQVDIYLEYSLQV